MSRTLKARPVLGPAPIRGRRIAFVRSGYFSDQPAAMRNVTVELADTHAREAWRMARSRGLCESEADAAREAARARILPFVGKPIEVLFR